MAPLPRRLPTVLASTNVIERGTSVQLLGARTYTRGSKLLLLPFVFLFPCLGSFVSTLFSPVAKALILGWERDRLSLILRSGIGRFLLPVVEFHVAFARYRTQRVTRLERRNPQLLVLDFCKTMLLGALFSLPCSAPCSAFTCLRLSSSPPSTHDFEHTLGAADEANTCMSRTGPAPVVPQPRRAAAPAGAAAAAARI